MSSILEDLRVAVRLLGKYRGFSVTAILALSLLIGAKVAIFSVINSIQLRPMPFERADELVRNGAIHAIPPSV